MVRKVREKTQLERLEEAAKKKRDDAKAVLEKTNNVTNKTAYDNAVIAYDAAKAKADRDRFEIIAGGRVSATAQKIVALGKIAGQRNYKYAQDDIDAAFTYLGSELKTAQEAFERSLSAPGAKATNVKKFAFGK